MSRRAPVACTRCGSDRVRAVRSASLKESVLSWLGYEPARCLDCASRFLAPAAGGISGFLYAKCPRCLRMDLATWQPAHYRPGLWVTTKLRLGANPWRCESCRANFASFRPRKWTYARPGSPASPGESGPQG